MACVFIGEYNWNGGRDAEGYRSYKLAFKVKGTINDGPAAALQTPGLPVPGALWIVRDDVDVWTWFRNDAQMEPMEDDGPNKFWKVTMSASNKPPENQSQRCNTTTIDNPLLEPMKISGGFAKFSKEATVDRFGKGILNSAFERLTGGSVEFDENRPNVKIEQNVLNLELPLLASLIDCVNDSTMWGLLPRCVKLSSVSWERKFYGTCFKYYTRSLEFDTNYATFDKYVIDEGTKVIHGRWDTEPGSPTYRGYIVSGGANKLNPSHMIKFKDFNGDPARVILDGNGRPYDSDNSTPGTGDDQVGKIKIEKYTSANLFLLNVPTTL